AVYSALSIPRSDPSRGVVLVTEVLATGNSLFAVFVDDGNSMSLVQALDQPPFDTLVQSDRLRGFDAENSWVAFATGPRNRNETDAVHRVSPSGVAETLVDRSSDVPGSNGSFRAFALPRVDRNGGVVFSADQTGSPGSAIYRFADGGLVPIAVEGDAAPDGASYQPLFTDSFGMGSYTASADGDVVFSDLDFGDPTGLYAWTPGAGVLLVARDGTAIDADADPLVEKPRTIAMLSNTLTDVPMYMPTIGADRRLGFRLSFDRPFSILGYAADLPPLPCLADSNGDGTLTPADFNAWVIAFNAGDPAADQNQDGSINPDDFNAWVINYNAGC
ncbi:MAG: GC-type dockerin domain-anchored protein, partial [Planctomycetota bacterium]